jgi:hypothetical protein
LRNKFFSSLIACIVKVEQQKNIVKEPEEMSENERILSNGKTLIFVSFYWLPEI